jgi:hypothetical protein
VREEEECVIWALLEVVVDVRGGSCARVGAVVSIGAAHVKRGVGTGVYCRLAVVSVSMQGSPVASAVCAVEGIDSGCKDGVRGVGFVIAVAVFDLNGRFSCCTARECSTFRVASSSGCSSFVSS